MLYEGRFLADIDQGMVVHLPAFDATGPQRDAKRAAMTKAAEAKMKELIDAAREGDPVKRHAKLEKVLDLDRFLTFMACEALSADWDGYPANRNNYRVYHDPKADRLVFMPQGMDQMFQRPDFELMQTGGLVAAAVLGIPEDRQKYLDRVEEIRAKAFATDRVLAQLDKVAAQMTPGFAAIGDNAVRDEKNQIADLRNRILTRTKAVDQALRHSRPLRFDAGGAVLLADLSWEAKVTRGNAAVDRIEQSGKPLLRVICQSPDANASWRTTVTLAQGKYLFEARLKTADVKAADGPLAGAGLRISGATQRPAVLGTTEWQIVKFELTVDEPVREVVLVCDCRASVGTALFDLQDIEAV